MTQTSDNPGRDILVEPEPQESLAPLEDSDLAQERTVVRLRRLWDERRFLSRCAGLGLVLATALAFLIPSRYESSAQLMPPDTESSGSMALLAAFSGQASGLGAIASELLGLKSTGGLFMGVLKSRTVQDKIIDRFDLKKVYGVRLEEKARQKLTDNTVILEDKKSGIIKLTVTDRSPQRVAAIAGAYVTELDHLMVQLSTSSARRERIFLEQRLSGVKEDLESAEKDFGQFASKNATVDISEQAKAMVGAAATLEGQLIAAESELEGLKQIYTDSNVRVRTIQARIAELRRQLQNLGGKAGSASSSRQATSASLYPSLRELPVLGVPYADLFRRLKLEEAIFETLTKEYEIAKVQEAKEIPTVKVLDSPEVPEQKSFPPRLLIILSGTLGILILGIAWVFGTARWKEIDSQDPGKLFAQEVFGTLKARIPWISANGLQLGSNKVGNRSNNSDDQSPN